MLIVTYRKVFFILTGIAVAASLVAVAFFGLHLSTEFTGGTLIEVRYEGDKPGVEQLAEAVRTAGLSEVTVRESGASGFTVRAGTTPLEVREKLPQALSFDGTYTAQIDRLSEVGPTIGKELRNKSILAMSLVLVCILLFIAFAFRKVSKPVSSWIYGSAAIVALIHNVVVTLGFYAVLGHFFGAQVDALFVTALLTIVGFSVHDTIVVFDRLRENLRTNQDHNRKEDFELTAGRSLNQTFVRSVNTSLTVVVTLLALFFMGPISTQDFALTLLVGIVAGTYSSLALATPLLVTIEKWRRK